MQSHKDICTVYTYTFCTEWEKQNWKRTSYYERTHGAIKWRLWWDGNEGKCIKTSASDATSSFLPFIYIIFLQSKQIIMYEAYVWTDRVYARADRGGTHRKTKRRTKSNCRSEHRKSKQLQKFINKFKTVLCFLLLLFWKINKKKFIAFSPKNKIDDLWLIDCCLPKIISKKRK